MRHASALQTHFKGSNTNAPGILGSGGLAIATHNLEKTGASLDIHVTYIGTAQIGDTLEVEAIADKVGRSVAFTTIRIYKIVDDQKAGMVATASHTKYIAQPKS